MLDTVFGDGNLALKLVGGLIIVIGLIAAFFWGLRRFGGERLGAAGGRGRQPRLAVIDAAMVDGRRRLVLIRRDNVEHLLIIGGPTDVVVEQNIVRAGGAPREAAPGRPTSAPDTAPRPVPLGEGNLWPLQPEPAPREAATREPAPREPAPREPVARDFPPRSEPPTRIEPVARPEAPFRLEPMMRSEPAPRAEPPMRAEPRPQRAELASEASGQRGYSAVRAHSASEDARERGGDTRPEPGSSARVAPPPLAMPVEEEPMQWSTEPEPPPLPLPPRERKTRTADPLAGLAEELARMPSISEPINLEEPPPAPPPMPRQPPRRLARSQPAAATPAPQPAPAEPTADPQFNSAADQNLAEMAQRLEAALRRPAKSDEPRAAPAAPKAAGEPQAEAEEEQAAAAPAPPPARSARADAKALRVEPKPAPQKSLYDSLEQEMASLLGRPNIKP